MSQDLATYSIILNIINLEVEQVELEKKRFASAVE